MLMLGYWGSCSANDTEADSEYILPPENVATGNAYFNLLVGAKGDIYLLCSSVLDYAYSRFLFV